MLPLAKISIVLGSHRIPSNKSYLFYKNVEIVIVFELKIFVIYRKREYLGVNLDL